MEVIWTGAAKHKQREIILHIAEVDPDAALNLMDIFEEGARKLEKFPALGRVGKEFQAQENCKFTNIIFWFTKSPVRKFTYSQFGILPSNIRFIYKAPVRHHVDWKWSNHRRCFSAVGTFQDFNHCECVLPHHEK